MATTAATTQEKEGESQKGRGQQRFFSSSVGGIAPWAPKLVRKEGGRREEEGGRNLKGNFISSCSSVRRVFSFSVGGGFHGAKWVANCSPRGAHLRGREIWGRKYDGRKRDVRAGNLEGSHFECIHSILLFVAFTQAASFPSWRRGPLRYRSSPPLQSLFPSLPLISGDSTKKSQREAVGVVKDGGGKKWEGRLWSVAPFFVSLPLSSSPHTPGEETAGTPRHAMPPFLLTTQCPL